MFDVTHDVNPNGTKAGERDIGGHVSELGSKNVLNIFLNLAEAATANQYGARLGQSESSFAVNCPE
jgi:hypothetical protein